MPLYHATTAIKGRAAADALSEALEALSPLVTEVHDRDDGSGLWEVGAYFSGRPEPARVSLLAAVHGAPDFAVAPVYLKKVSRIQGLLCVYFFALLVQALLGRLR